MWGHTKHSDLANCVPDDIEAPSPGPREVADEEEVGAGAPAFVLRARRAGTARRCIGYAKVNKPPTFRALLEILERVFVQAEVVADLVQNGDPDLLGDPVRVVPEVLD